jgi:hypothetical protein
MGEMVLAPQRDLLRFKLADIGHGISGCQPFTGNKPATGLMWRAL